MANKRNGELHKGHRQRLKDRADIFGLGSLSDHEKVELLLTYTIPRKDLNEISHVLLNTFGSFYNLLNSDKLDIMKVKGIGKESALFLKLIPQYFDFYKQSKLQGKIKLETSISCVEYFRTIYDVEDSEEAYLAMLNEKSELIKIIPVTKESKQNEVELNDLLISREIEARKPKYVILFHTHPFGVMPSAEDLSSTVKIITSCNKLNTTVVDHIILNKDKYLSFKDSRILEELQTIANNRLSMIIAGDPKIYSNILSLIEKDNGK